MNRTNNFMEHFSKDTCFHINHTYGDSNSGISCMGTPEEAGYDDAIERKYLTQEIF